jgi:hypothetical protein
MKNYLILIVVISFTSCISTNQSFFSDPNYLSSNEFSSIATLEEAYNLNTENDEDTITYYEDNRFEANNYYDFSYSSRIRRFHSPMMYSTGFYSGIYTDYYWYNQDPFYYGSSIYFGHNGFSPYYSYSPFGYNSYYNHYGYNGHHGMYNNYYGYNNYTNNHYGENSNSSFGPRGSLVSGSSKTVVKYNTLSNQSFQNTQQNGFNNNSRSTVKKPWNNNNVNNNNSINSPSETKTKSNKTFKKNNSYKSNNRSNDRSNSIKSNNRSNSFKSNNRSNSRPSGGGSGRTKPKK